ncbi:Holliday junction branch migration protein RuvA [Thermomicrobium sp. CFH 73360]|uniref:Holliday junction branch migration protein RuvA n=1 Tax=Thermomicrobium sp. CFH 73360 TaxID=2951987 RepID=UPI0020777660|nr:Holliday junction branch migration protein RuvA [Thermomicrobium sp. CFH 73360]
MIRGLRGTLVSKRPGELLVDVQGVIFRVQTSATTLQELGDPGECISLLTHLMVREEELALYGFATETELELFLSLLGVSGVGPRGALSVLSLAPPERIAEWIREEQVEQLARAPGVGRKTASRIVLELRGRLPSPVPSSGVDELDRELLAALQALGYTAQEARMAAVQPDVRAAETLEQRILAALRHLAPS